MSGGTRGSRPESNQKVTERSIARPGTAAVAVLAAAVGLALVGPPPVEVRAGTKESSANGPAADHDAELRRVAALDRVLAEGAATRVSGGVPTPRLKPLERAGGVPTPRLKPLERDRSDQVIALLTRAGPAPAPAAPADDGSAGPSSAANQPEQRPVEATTPAAASDPIEQLRNELAARDVLIANLLQRVEQLERRIVLSASQLDQAVGGAGPVSLLRRPVAEAPPPVAGAAASTTDPVAAEDASEPVQTAQAQPPTTEGQAAPPRAPGQFEVEEGAIDRALERTLVQEGVLLLPLGQAEIEPSFTYTRREFDAPTFVIVDGDTFVGEQDIRRDEFQTAATLRVGLPFDSQIEVGVPYNYVDQSVDTTVGGAPQSSNSESGHGFGDVSVGLAKTLLQEGAGWWPDVIARVTWDADTGKTSDNGVFLGGGFNTVGGSLSAVKRQDPLAFVGSVSYAKTFEHDDIEPGDEVGFSLGTVLAASPETSLSFFFNQTFADDTKVDGDTINGSDQVVGTFSIGAATILGRNTLLSITGEIGLTDAAPDYAIGASLPIRFDLPTF
jgi:Putative MetA-pathway of phenol degradation